MDVLAEMKLRMRQLLCTCMVIETIDRQRYYKFIAALSEHALSKWNELQRVQLHSQ